MLLYCIFPVYHQQSIQVSMSHVFDLDRTGLWCARRDNFVYFCRVILSLILMHIDWQKKEVDKIVSMCSCCIYRQAKLYRLNLLYLLTLLLICWDWYLNWYILRIPVMHLWVFEVILCFCHQRGWQSALIEEKPFIKLE